MFCRFVVMVLGVKMVSMRDVRVMSGFFVIAGFVMLRRLFVMMRGVPAMLCSVLMMLRGGRVCHWLSSVVTRGRDGGGLRPRRVGPSSN